MSPNEGNDTLSDNKNEMDCSEADDRNERSEMGDQIAADGDEEDADEEGDDDDSEDDDATEDEDDETEDDEEESDEENIPNESTNGQTIDAPMSPNSVPTCYICLNEFEGQDVGSPDSCENIHHFCLECIEEWSKVSLTFYQC